MRTVTAAERRARLAARHHLAPGAGAPDVATLAAALVGIHATDPATVFLSLRARVPGAGVADVERALYDDRSVVRVIGMRRTLFVVPAALVPVVQAACGRVIGARERRRTVQLVEQAGLVPAGEGERWVARVADATMAAILARGEATATELTADVAELRHQIPFGEGRKWAGVQGVSTRVLFLLAAEGRIVRGRPRGSWLSSQYRWAPVEAWVPGGVGDLEPAGAQAELVRRWLAAFGPGTVDDLKWWTGLTLTETRRALAAAGAVEVDLGGVTGVDLDGGALPVEEVPPWVALLPALDTTVMGWQDRSWFLGAHRPALFDTNGNAGPTVWVDGRVAGGWAQRPDGEVVTRLLEDVGAEAQAAVAKEAADLTAWFGGTRITPRFRTPLERELSG